MAMFDPTQGFQQAATGPQYAPEQQALLRKQKMIEAMMQQSQEQPIYGRSSGSQWIQGLSKLGTQLGGVYMQDKMGQQGAELEGQRRQALAQELMGYQQKVEGRGDTLSTADAGALMNDNVEPGFGSKERTGDPRGALISALGSQHPEMQQMAMMQLQAEAKRKQTTPEDFTVGNARYRTMPDGTTKLLVQNKSDEDNWVRVMEKDAEGKDVPALKNMKNGDVKILDKGTKVNVQTNVDTGDKAFDKKFGEEGAKQAAAVIPTTREEAANSAALVDSGVRMYELAQSPDLISGFGAGKVAGLAALASKLGVTGPNAVQTTQAMLQESATKTLEMVTKLKGPTSDKDIAFLKDVVGGNIDLDPKVLQHVAGLAIQYGHNNMLESHAQRQSAIEAYPELDKLSKLQPFKQFNYKLPEGAFDYTNEGQRGERVKFKGSLGGATAAGNGMGGAPASPNRVIKW